MLPRVSWMNATDSIILLFLSEHRWRVVANPAVVALNCGLSSSHANRRLKLLEGAGLVEMADERGYYRITDLGVQFILGNLTESDLEGLGPEDC